jgi:hypothetical protein
MKFFRVKCSGGIETIWIFYREALSSSKEYSSLYELQFYDFWKRKNETYAEKPGLLDKKFGKIIGCCLLVWKRVLSKCVNFAAQPCTLYIALAANTSREENQFRGNRTSWVGTEQGARTLLLWESESYLAAWISSSCGCLVSQCSKPFTFW